MEKRIDTNDAVQRGVVCYFLSSDFRSREEDKPFRSFGERTSRGENELRRNKKTLFNENTRKSVETCRERLKEKETKSKRTGKVS